jgi:hypothetical protein
MPLPMVWEKGSSATDDITDLTDLIQFRFHRNDVNSQKSDADLSTDRDLLRVNRHLHSMQLHVKK